MVCDPGWGHPFGKSLSLGFGDHHQNAISSSGEKCQRRTAKRAALADAAPQICGGSWTSRPGNSSNPPDSVPPFMAVIASSSITKSGATISGDVPKIVIVKTNPGYGPSPGQTGTGTVVAVLCGS